MSVVSILLDTLAVGVGGFLCLSIFLYVRKKHVDTSFVHSVGIMHRKISDNPELAATGWKEICPTLLPSEPLDIVNYIDGGEVDFPKENSFVLVCGKSGVGKTSLTTLIIHEWEKKKDFPCVVFSLKQRAEHQSSEFNLPNFRTEDMSLHAIADINSNRYAFLSSFLTALYSDLTNRGVMSHSIKTTLHDLVSDTTIKTWDDLEKKVMKALKENRNANFDMATLNAILGDIRILKEEVKGEPLNIDFGNLKENLILDFGLLGHGELSVVITFWAEFYLRMLFKTRKKFYVALTESWRLLNNTETVLSVILKEGRVSWAGAVLDTQSYSAVSSKNMQMATVFQHRTGDSEDYKQFRPFVADAVEQLKGRQFIDLMATHSGETKIYEMDIKEFYDVLLGDANGGNVYVPPIKDEMELSETSSKTPTQVSTPSAVVEPEKRDKEKLRTEITELLKEGAYYQNEVCKKVGITDREDTDRTVVKNILKSLVDNKIAKKEIYINHKGKEIKYYFINERRGESALHKKGVNEMIEVAKSIGIEAQGHYVSNQNWDVETELAFFDFKRLTSNFKDDIAKLKGGQKTVIFCCMNRLVEARHRESLQYANVEGARYFVCTLSEFAGVLRELVKSG